MRRCWPILLLLAGFLPGLAAAEKFSLRISYGAARINPADLNHFLSDFAATRKDAGYSLAEPALKTLDWSSDFEIAAAVLLDAHVSLLLSAGFVGAEQIGNDIDYSTGYAGGTWARNDRIRAFVARLGASYALPLSSRLTLRPHASVDGYWSSFQDDGSETYGWNGEAPQAEHEWTVNATAFNFGFTVGLGLDVAVWSKLSLSLDAGWRQARLSGFAGNLQKYEYGIAAPLQEFRLLYVEQYVDWLKTTYRLLNVPELFGGTVVRVLRDAVLDLSGFYASAGIKISF
jgi:hypothetical protein